MDRVVVAFIAAMLPASSACAEVELDDERAALAFEVPHASPHTFDLVPDEQDSVCECTTDACVDDWIRETIGCGVCVVYVCPDPFEDAIVCTTQMTASKHRCVTCDAPSAGLHTDWLR